MIRAIQGFVHRIVFPVDLETRTLLRSKWNELPDDLRTPHQIYGRNEEGCGATIGVMPRCDFACRGCYLGEKANSVPSISVSAVKIQLRTLRAYLGKRGNLQLTDGEVTLRPVDELIEIIRYARELGLVPMVMTHGDTFLRNPDLLLRLMREAGLEEISLHIDSTQRGRRDPAFRRARTEAELIPLRDQFADMIRTVRRETGLPLRVATTMTVSRENLHEVPDVLKWLIPNSDAIRLITFLPMAQVGRTLERLGGGIALEDLWDQIRVGLSYFPAGGQSGDSDRRWWMGHPACSRFLLGAAVLRPDGRSSYHTAGMAADPVDQAFMERFFKRFAGITFRGDTRGQRISRALGMVIRAPLFTALVIPRYAFQWMRRAAPDDAWRFALELLTGRARVHRLTVSSHHFMSSEELKTSLGRERERYCVFKVPVDGKMVSMCKFNAEGGRDQLYGDLLKASTAHRPKGVSELEVELFAKER